MAHLVLLVLVVGLSTTTLTSDGSGTAATQPTGRASLKIVAVEPVAVAGRGFKPRERVKVAADGRRKTITASARGGFKVVFPEASVCNGFAAIARGSQGSRASVTFAQFSNVHCLEPRSTQSVTASSARTPALRVMTREPLAVRGTGFRPAEKVRITALGSIKRLVRQTTADERGTFKASFRLGADRTSHLVVAAVGSQGSRAFVSVKRRLSGPPPRE